MPDPAQQNPQTPDPRDPLADAFSADRSNRRSFLKQGAFAAGTALFNLRRHPFGLGATRRPRGRTARAADAPNILTIMVDQLRTPVWMPAGYEQPDVMPNLTALQEQSVSFERHYTAANDCSPSRSVLLTGLLHAPDGGHDHRRRLARPGLSNLGNAAAQDGLRDRLLRKVAPEPERVHVAGSVRILRRHLPIAQRQPGAGTVRDPFIAEQFIEWFDGHAGKEPWATTVSFVNPHDMAFWYKFTQKIASREQPAGARPGVAPQLRDAGTARRKGQADAAALAPGHDGRRVRRGAVHGPRSAGLVDADDGHLPAAAGLRRRTDRPGLRGARQQAGDRGEHRHHLHLRPRRVLRLARDARQGRLGLRGGDARPAVRL